MSFWVIILALVIENIRGLGQGHWLRRLADGMAQEAEALSAGRPFGARAWWILAFGSALCVWFIDLFAGWLGWPFAVAWQVFVLYQTMGWSRFHARFMAAQSEPQDGLTAETVDSRALIRQGLVDAQRRVFAVLFWYLLLPGPSGAILYRATDYLNHRWRATPLGQTPARAFAILDGAPAILTAIAFAIVGNFEEASYRARQAFSWNAADGSGVVIAAAEGALGLSLQDDPNADGAEPLDDGALRSAQGLVWRAAVFCLVVIAVTSALGLWS